MKDTRQRLKLALLAFAFTFSVLFICAPPVWADENELTSTDCVEALTPVWDRLALLNAQEVESLVNILKELNLALFSGINGNPPVLTAQQQFVLKSKYALDYSGLLLPQVLDAYVNTHQSKGAGGYAGFVQAVSPVNRDVTYLADLYETLRNALPLSYRVEMNHTWGWGERERLEFYIKLLKTIKLDPAGNISCPRFDALVERYIINVSKITKKDLDDAGFNCQLFAAAILQLTSEEKTTLAGILTKIGLGSASLIKGNVFLEKVYPADPEPNHAGTLVKVKKNGDVVASAASLPSGSYEVGSLSAGSYQASFDRPDGSWKEEIRPVTLGEGEVKTLEDVLLRLGDMNDDGTINILDLLWMAARMGPVTGPESQKADVNKDGQVNILDLLRVAQNMGL
ncbi:hypothetical protein DK28_0206590 [Peptococcaceae bacterium SCADC1_2_3]|nr:hypothetical protein DK28_0206590 [Peptococcaceae bacterium SCADC1_2_3]KFI35465.1 hypothetical protein HY00_04880 [Peptococcaceae bacterium SCADC1_2_3]